MYLKFLNIIASNAGALSREYKEIDSISAYGNSYFDTGIIFDKDMQIEAKAIISADGIWGAGMSGVVGATLSHSGFGIYIASLSQIPVSKNIWHEYIANNVNNQCVVDGVVKGTFSNIANFVPSTTCSVFAVHQGGYIIPGTGRLAYFRIRKHDGTLLCDYVACVRKIDGVAGMYDKVSNTFKQSMTSTPFTVY